MTTRPYRGSVRAAATEQTRRRIVTAASAVLRAKGAAGFSLESVAKEAGVTRLTVYNQFGSRQALLEAIFDDRAATSGLQRLFEAMADSDPRAGLRRLVEIFCAFWSLDPGSLAGLHAAASGDALFEASLRARNERRRKAISVLVGRLAERGDVDPNAGLDLTDVAFVLTSFHSYAEIAAGRTPDEACALIQQVVDDAVRRAAPR